MFDHLNTHPNYKLKSGYVARLCCCIITLYFQQLQTLLVTVQVKNNIRNIPASAALTYINRDTEHIMVPNLV